MALKLMYEDKTENVLSNQSILSFRHLLKTRTMATVELDPQFIKALRLLRFESFPSSRMIILPIVTQVKVKRLRSPIEGNVG